MKVPSQVQELISRFQEQRDVYLSPAYGETQVRIEFINPLFAALGWDIANSHGLNPTVREVVHEDALNIQGSHRAPDYSFRIGGQRKFFVEAKKPSVNLQTTSGPAFQLRRYGFSAGLPISVLTNFRELVVYDCRQEPSLSDEPAMSILLHFDIEDLGHKWDDINRLLSKDAVVGGALDVYAAALDHARGSSPVDNIFLKEIEGWRTSIAKDLAIKNLTLTQAQLNLAVQQIIDRIVFLRIAEDRGIEPYGQLEIIIERPDIYKALVHLFRKADNRYNSGLFHFRAEESSSEAPDTLTPHLQVSDETLRSIIRRLYYPLSPYEFSVLPAAILGHVYEQFLGSVIRLDKSHRATVTQKPEVRKAGGVYYTPTSIVDFVVQSAVFPGIDARSPTQLAGEGRAKDRHPYRILDPACGSGSFLLGAYDFLLNWYLTAYVASDPAKWARGRSPRIKQSGNGDWQLTIDERKQVLLRHLYGVDIDPQAVEVTKLSLLLKVLEGETLEAIQSQLQFFHERALPDLGRNIKCGNSLIDTDIFDSSQLFAVPDDDTVRINPFNWKDEFPEVFSSANGFDAVIGNPPYLDSETMTTFTPRWRDYCVDHYRSASGNWDVFCVFIERALELCCPGGRHSFIVPNKLGSAGYARSVRSIMSKDNSLTLLRDYSSVAVFPVSVYPVVYSIEKHAPSPDQPVLYERMIQDRSGMVRQELSQDLDRSIYFPADGSPWAIFADIDSASPVERMRSDFAPLSDVADVHGASTVSEAYEIADLVSEGANPSSQDLKMINSGTIDPYEILWGHKPMRYLGTSYDHPIIPLSLQHRLPTRRLSQAKTPKIVIAGMTRRLECVIDVDGTFLPGKSTTVIESEMDLLWLLGILNSQLMSFFYSSVFGGDRLQGGYLRIGPPQLKTLPIPPYRRDRGDSALSGQVSRLMELVTRPRQAGTGHGSALLDREITAITRTIDASVYKVYGLTEREVQVIERSLQV